MVVICTNSHCAGISLDSLILLHRRFSELVTPDPAFLNNLGRYLSTPGDESSLSELRTMSISLSVNGGLDRLRPFNHSLTVTLVS